jgi:gliding motility-associated-like protein
VVDSLYSKKQSCFGFSIAFILCQVFTYASPDGGPKVCLKQMDRTYYEISLSFPSPGDISEFDSAPTLHLSSELCGHTEDILLKRNDSNGGIVFSGKMNTADQCSDWKIAYSFLRLKNPVYYSFSLGLTELLSAGEKGLDISATPASATYEEVLLEAKRRNIPASDLPGYTEYRMYMNTEIQKGNWNTRIPSLPNTAGASCTNVDFEDGTLNGWNGTTGLNPGCCASPGFITGRQTITSGAGLDVCGGFPVVCPGGSYSLKLGNKVSGGLAEQLIQTFTVSASSTNFTYKYAVVLEDPGHSLAQQPFFKVEMLDQNGNPIPCSLYFVAAGQNIPGFLSSTTCPGVVYKPWSTVSVDLSGYVGQAVTIRFTAADCTLGGHFGYAYVDGTCLPLALSSSGDVCAGNTVTLTAPAGSQGYHWSPGGQTTQSISVNTSGTYSCTLTSVQGCDITLSIPVHFYPLPVALFSSASAPCSSTFNFTDLSSASDTINAWLWTFGNAGATANSQNQSHTYPAPGTYTVSLQVSTSHGCSSITSQMVTALVAPVASLVSTPVSCFGGNNGTVAASATGGVLPYTYSWSNGAATAQTTGLMTGTYVFTLSDAAGCKVTDSVKVNKPANALGVVTTGLPVTCFGASNGSSSAVVTGGTAPYTNVWSTSPVQTTATVQNLSAGVYTFTVTDNKGCVAVTTLTITEPPQVQTNIVSVQNVSCHGGHDGSVSSSVSGGVGPYTYMWNTTPVQTTANASNLSAGSFQLSVTDSKGCKATAIAGISEPSALNPFLVSASDPVCFGAATGQLTMNCGGGTPPYQFSWNTVPLQSSATAVNLAAGSYISTVTDAKGCVISATETLKQPVPLTIQTSSGNVSCNGGQNGTVTSAVSGGTAPYSYTWSTGSSQLPILSGLAAGSYMVTVTDFHLCSASLATSITEPEAPLALTTKDVPPACFNGSDGYSTAFVSGGTPVYFYSWNTSPMQTGALAQNLSSGLFTLSVTDQNGCSTSLTVNISQPAQLKANVIAKQNISCNGGHDGLITCSAAGGTSGYSYIWNTTPVQTGPTALNLTAGSYQVTVKDANGCTALQSVVLTQASPLNTVVVSGPAPSCFGSSNGQLSAASTGGTAPYQYSWNTVPSQSTALATNLGAGVYVLSVTDSKGCNMSTSANLTQPDKLITQTSSGNLKCFSAQNGWITSNVSGGTKPYSYSWNAGTSQSPSATGLGAGSYVLNITDAQGCFVAVTTVISQPPQLQAAINVSDETCNGGKNGWLSANVNGGTSPYSYSWNTGTSGTALIGLKAGTYVLTVTDNKGCRVSVPSTIHEPVPILLHAYGSTKICAGQITSLYALASGGNGSFNYLWNQGVGAGASQIVAPKISTAYIVTVTDNAGCSGPADTIDIQVIVLDSSSLVMSPDKNICPGQSASISVSVNGNAGTVTYSWSNNLGTGAGPFVLSPSSTTSYTVQVQNSCGAQASGEVSLVVHPFPVIAIAPQNVSGCGEVTLAFSNTASNPGSAYQWNFGDGSVSSLQAPGHTFLQTGNYTITLLVTSAAGCSKSGLIIDSIVVFTPTVASFTAPNEVSELSPRVIFTNLSQNAITTHWDFGDQTHSDEVNPIHTYKVKGTYTVLLKTVSPKGCVDSVLKVIEVLSEFSFYIPNAFTPNADGKNDIFNGKGEEIRDFNMLIFDRWGELIYSTDDKDKGWDGIANNGNEIAQSSVFVYKITLHDFTGLRHDYEGRVTLLK